jgi:1-acyl-sn-glycerol-3-phosphate acyltransferase
VTVSQLTQPRGRFLQWFHGEGGARWGTDPGEYSPEAVAGTLVRVARIFGPGRYFGLDVKGWENVPAAPAMIVSNHSGGTSIPDVWGFMASWYWRFGVHRPIHPMAHEIILSTRITGEFFARRGVLRANHRLAHEVLATWKRDLMVMPGGDLDTWRPYKKRYTVRFGGRTGYARLALRTGTPIVPVANAGAHETLIVLTDGRKFARAIGLYDLMRSEIFPVHLSLPWGLAIGPWPHLPTPTMLRYRIGPVVEPPVTLAPGEEPSEDVVKEYDCRVQEAVQRLLDDLREGR